MQNNYFSQLRLSENLLTPILEDQAQTFSQFNLGVEREVLSQLEAAVKSSHILVITGLRRVGKSTLLAQIAFNYLKDNDFFYVNFEDERLLNFKTTDFDNLHETLISLYGERQTFLLDEIQNIPQWERFVRRLHDRGIKFILTGSNASLLSQELGTRLTGRYLGVELFPFSFREYLKFLKSKHQSFKIGQVLTTRERGRLIKNVNQYMQQGGVPDVLKYPELDIHKTLYDDILYRDIASRYNIENIKALKELSLYLTSNVANLISFNKLKNLLKLGSTNTVKNYIDYLENSWLFFVVNKFAASVKEQQIAPKKIYGIDSGLIQSIGFSFSGNTGRLMENLVFLQLRRKYGNNIFYYKTKNDHEVDFYLPKHGLMVQVCDSFDDKQVKIREIRALLEAKQERKTVDKLIIITRRDQGIFVKDNLKIQLIPLYNWLLESNS